VGLPGTNGFVGEFLILVGGFKSSVLAGVLGATGIIIGAAYMLWLYQKIFFVAINPNLIGHGEDMNVRELLTITPLLILVFWIGCYPNPFLSIMDVSVQHLLERIASAGQSPLPQTALEVVR
jgi:NADH-quinone oxidoreductase subunit M